LAITWANNVCPDHTAPRTLSDQGILYLQMTTGYTLTVVRYHCFLLEVPIIYANRLRVRMSDLHVLMKNAPLWVFCNASTEPVALFFTILTNADERWTNERKIKKGRPWPSGSEFAS